MQPGSNNRDFLLTARCHKEWTIADIQAFAEMAGENVNDQEILKEVRNLIVMVEHFEDPTLQGYPKGDWAHIAKLASNLQNLILPMPKWRHDRNP